MPTLARTTLSFAAAVALALTLPAHALQQVAELEVTYLYPDVATVYAGPTSIGLGGSLSTFAGILDIGLSDGTITMRLTTTAGVNDVNFDGLRFVDLLQNLNLGGFALNTQQTTYAGFDASRLSTTGPHTLFVNLQGLPGQVGQQIVLQAAPVPEPAAWALLAVGLGGLMVAARRARA